MYKYLLSFIRHRKEDTSPVPDRAEATQQFAVLSLRGMRKRHSHLRHDVIMMSRWFVVLLRMSRFLQTPTN